MTGQPGAAGIGDSYYADLGNGGYDARHYTLDLTTGKPGGPITATVTLAAEATQDLSAFNLDFRGFEISAVSVNGEAASYQRDGGELTIALPQPLAAGTPFTGTIAYSGIPEPVASRTDLPFKLGWLTGKDASFVISEPDAASSWYPVNDHPRDKATYTFRVTVPKPYMAVANGILKGTTEQADSTTYLWEASDPMASYLVTIAIGEFEVRETPGPNGLTLRTYYPEAAAERVAAAFDTHADALGYFGEIFGPYPFESYGIIIVDADFGGALETQTLPIYGLDYLWQSADIESTAVEELAHQWFGDSVSPANWQDVWLNEGFGVYATWLWDEHTGGSKTLDAKVREEYAALTLQGLLPGLKQMGADITGVPDDKIEQLFALSALPPPAVPPEDDLFNRGVYHRGALALHALRLRVGDEAFFKILREYYDQHKYATASTEDFIATAEKISGISLAEFFDPWLYDEKAVPDIPEMKLFHKVQASVVAPALRVLDGPGADYDELASVSQGAILRVLSQTDACAWLQVRTPDTVIGWVSGGSGEVELTQPCDAVPAAEAPPAPPGPVEISAEDLEEAIAKLRDVDFSKLTDEQQKTKNTEIDEALTAITSADERGAGRLKQEIEALSKVQQHDVFFELLASWGLWDIGGLDEAEAIARISRGIPVDQRNEYYDSFFSLAVRAARTQDPRALPLLELLLADDQGHISMLEYPLTHEFLWGNFGPKGLPVLHEILKTSKENIPIESAIRLLSRSQYLPGLPEIRAAVASEAPRVRHAAVAALGRFGHPDDYETLAAGLAAGDADDLVSYASALGPFGDIRAVPQLVPLLSHKDDSVRDAAISTLGSYLITPEGLQALHDHAAQFTDGDEKSYCEYYVKNALEDSGLTWEAFAAKSPAEQEEIADESAQRRVHAEGGRGGTDPRGVPGPGRTMEDIRPAVDRGLRRCRDSPHPARCHGGRHRPAARGEGQILRPHVGRMH